MCPPGRLRTEVLAGSVLIKSRIIESPISNVSLIGLLFGFKAFIFGIEFALS